ncbi:TIGR02996 domain-containing protein [Tuwongella immobilis]|nr:TIGR02996 domain-containing protein [Tuwongella immobilis]
MQLPADLFTAITVTPDDLWPRLVAADWFEEQGDADRATFIRLQCRLATLCPYSPEATLGRLEEREWLRRLGHRWRLPLPNDWGQTFRRGFVEDVQLPAAAFLSEWRALLAMTPLRGVVLTQVAGRLSAVLECDGLAACRSLELENAGLDALALARLGLCPQLESLRELRLIRQGLGSAAMEQLARGSVFCQLESLDLHGNPLNDIGARALAQSHAFPHLRSLRLSQAGEVDYLYSIRSAGAAALAIGWHFEHLRELNLSGQFIGDSGLAFLARSQSLAGLELLNIADNDVGAIGTTGIEALADDAFSRLRVLILAGNPLGDLAIRELMRWPGIPNLRYLDLSRCSIGSSVRAILDAPWSPECVIDLRHNRFRDEWRIPLQERFADRLLLEERHLPVPLR